MPLGLVNAGGLMAAKAALRSMLQARAEAERQRYLDEFAERKQSEVERSAKSREGVDYGRLDLDTDKFTADAPKRSADVDYTKAQTGALTQKTSNEAADRSELSGLINMLPESVEGQTSPRTLAGLKRLGVDFISPSGERALSSPQQRGAATGAETSAAWEGGGEQVYKDKSQIDLDADLKGIYARGAQGGQGGLSPNQELLAINRLQKDWQSATGNYNELKRQEANMRTGMEAARRGDLAAGSQAVLVTFQKILDPTSVVRESEYARSASGQSLLSRMEGIVQTIAKGGAGVPVSELEKFSQLASEMLKNSDTGLAGRRGRLQRTAQKYGIDPSLVFDDSPTGGGAGQGAAASSAPAAPAAPQGPAVGAQQKDARGRTIEWDGKGWFIVR